MFVVYAHRGASEYAPENTMSSFMMGVQMGANGIETDVRRTKDGVLVLFHDGDFKRVIGCEGRIADYTYEELMQFRVKNEKTDTEDIIIKFEDFLRYLGFRDLHFAIELKEDLAAETIEMLERFNMKDKAIITSFQFDYIKRVKELRPDWRIGYLVREVTDEVLSDLASVGGEQLCPRAKFVNAEDVAKWHAMGLNVRAWGVTDFALMKNAYDCGVDGMTVNFPDQLIRYMTAKQ
jgi:glycerophosphoryl diester phosphodiesterase